MNVIRILASSLVVLATSAVADVKLAPAPWWNPEAPPPPQREGFGAKAVSMVPAIDTTSRAAVVAAYNAYYNIAMPAVGFTGSSVTCAPGSISLAFQEWTVTRINFLRAMAGVPGNTTLDSGLNGQEQAAALIMAANDTLTHYPSPGMACYTQAGYDGAGSSNLAIGTGLTDAIPLYMSDPGSGNEVVGHRRWILHSRKSRFGLGNATGSPYNANALYAFDFGANASAPNGIAWPPRGYVPLALFPTPFGGEGQRWSFGLPGANFGAASVTMTVNGSPLPVAVLSRTDDGYGDNTIVWALPAGHVVAAGSTYAVSITGVSGSASATHAYQVLPFDPAAPAPTDPPRLSNISTRGQVQTGDNVMIGGFIIGGATPKTVVVRARGPSLAQFGVPGVLANPQLQLFSGQTPIASNDNWQQASNLAAIQASGFAPTDANESAILATLGPGAYSAIVTGAGGSTGVAIVEVFEVNATSTPLVNISTRGRVLTGDDVMIGGFVIQGNGPQTVVVRARGPSLSQFGVPGVLANPQLQLFQGQTPIASNDNWQQASNVPAIIASGQAPTNTNESTILMTLQPGAYSAIVSGANGSTGVGIVEVFTVP
jgi:hypothetical protein